MSFGSGSECCQPCPTVQTVSIPGASGANGEPGAPGADGLNAYGILAANMIVPPDTSTPVTISVDTSQWAVIGGTIIIGEGQGGALANPGPAHFIITAIASAMSLTLLWLNESGDVPAGTQIDLGAVVTPAGQQGVSATFPTTTKGDLMIDDGTASPSAHVVRFPVGVNGQSIFADSTTVRGAKYAGGSQTLNVNVTQVVNPNNAVENTLMSFTVPANTLLTNGDHIEFECGLFFANTVGDKRIRVYFGASVLLDLNTVGPTDPAQNQIVCRGKIFRTGAATQLFVGSILSYGLSNGTQIIRVATQILPGETLAAPVLFKTTGKLAVAGAGEIAQVSQVVNYRAV